MTALALAGFSYLPSFYWLILAAIPLGLGAGSVDAGLNAHVAAHYESRHMSWLHSFWGVGALSGPIVISFALSRSVSWRMGYASIAAVQALLVVVLAFTLPLWDRVRLRGFIAGGESGGESNGKTALRVSHP
jgi:MFS family permease